MWGTGHRQSNVSFLVLLLLFFLNFDLLYLESFDVFNAIYIPKFSDNLIYFVATAASN